MRAFWLILRKDLIRKVRSPVSTVAMLLFPVVFSLLIGATFGSRGEKIASIRVALVDQDKGLAAQMLRSSLGREEMVPRVEAALVDSAEGIRLVEKDKVSAMVRIPPGFTDSLLSARSTFLEVVKNPAQGTYPRVVEQMVKAVAQLGGSAVRLIEKPIRDIRRQTEKQVEPPDQFISDVSILINRKMRSVVRYVLPPAIRIENVDPDGAKKEGAKGEGTKKKDDASPFRVAVYVLPGMAVFALLMLGMVHMADFQRERIQGTLARQLIAPVTPAMVVLGKIGATWVLSLLSIFLLAVIATVWAKVDVSLIGFICLSLAVALAATGFAGFVQSLTRSERTGSAIGSILVMIMAMVGGSWIPLEYLPKVALKIAPFTLTYWAGQGYRSLVFEGAGPGQLLPHIGILGGLGLFFSLFAVWRFRRRLAEGA